MTFVPWPLVNRDALVRGFRPGSGTAAEAPFRTLRRKGLVTAGVVVVVHSGGRIASRHQVFSALNFDSARLARQDRWEEARTLELSASKLESGPEMGELVALLRHLPPEVTVAYTQGRLPDRNDYPMLWHLTILLAQRTSELRELLLRRDDAGRMGIVEAGRGSEAVIKMSRGSDVTVPMQMTSGLGLSEAGSVVTLFSDVTVAGQLLMDVLPGFRLSEEDAGWQPDPFADTREPLVIPAGALNVKSRIARPVARGLPVSG